MFFSCFTTQEMIFGLGSRTIRWIGTTEIYPGGRMAGLWMNFAPKTNFRWTFMERWGIASANHLNNIPENGIGNNTWVIMMGEFTDIRIH